MSNRYINFNRYFKDKFNCKVAKLSLDGGFSCPNRDGKLSVKGCLFCSEKGSGDFAGNRKNSIHIQIDEQKNLLSKKWNAEKYIAYFQNFTNTYGSVNELKHLYESVLKEENIVGIAIATRCDCLSNEIISLLKEISNKTFLWLELGLQTTNENTLKLINRGYTHKVFDETIKKLDAENIMYLVHIIFGLPYETETDMEKTVDYVNSIHPFGVKIHSLYIQEDAPIKDYYLENNFSLLTQQQYVNLVCTTIEKLPKSTVYHRLTGDPHREKLVAPKWCANKLGVLSTIEKELKNRGLPII